MSDLQLLKARLVRFSHRLYDAEHVVALDGNLSVRVEDQIIITPTQCCKKDVCIENLVTVAQDGTVLSVGQPSSELQLHLLIYQLFPQVQAVCHAHPFYTTLMSIKEKEMQPDLLTEAMMHLPNIRYMEVVTPGSAALVSAAESALDAASSALVMRRHGSVTWGTTIEQAYYQTESLERLAKTCFYHGI